MQDTSFLSELGISTTEVNSGVYDGTSWEANGEVVDVVSPYTNEVVAQVQNGSVEDYERVAAATADAQKAWGSMPAPARGEIVRQIGNALREAQDPLGKAISVEMGKIKAEGLGEVQESIDICDYATGLSRMLQNKMVPSERPGHVLMEVWNPMGPTGVISAFNFPNAVYCWNAMIAFVVGNTVTWKPAPTANLVAIATTKVIAGVLEANDVPGAVASLICGDVPVGKAMAEDKRYPLLSFTGSTEIGAEVGRTVRDRWGRTILELGGNAAHVVEPDANLDLAIQSTVFGSVGTAGQRCTSTRRILLHESIADEFKERMIKAYSQIKAGDPLDDNTLLCPLHSKAGVEAFLNGVERVKAEGGEILYGGEVMTTEYDGKETSGNFVVPTITAVTPDMPVVQEEMFVPIVHTMTYSDLDEAIAISNSTEQQLASALFTGDMRKLFKWVGPNGIHTGVTSVGQGVSSSGAEIGGAFGGNFATGEGRESGSDAWKQYCLQTSVTVNASDSVVLAQGIDFS